MSDGLTVLAAVIDPDCQGEIVLLLHNGDNEEYVCSTGNPRSVPQYSRVLQLKSMENGSSPIQLGLDGLQTSAMKVWVTPPGKEPQPAEVIGRQGRQIHVQSKCVFPTNKAVQYNQPAIR